jgi:multidrug resistance efflux pump
VTPKTSKKSVSLSVAGPETPGAPPSGFPRGASTSEAPAIVRPTPLPKRPKGRWFVGLILLTATTAAGHQIWDSFFRYQAYGAISGRVLQLSAPWDGSVRYLHVKDGLKVRQGDLLVTVDNTEMRHKYAQLGDELRVAQATLDAEAAKLKWQLTFNLDQSHGAVAQYYEALGQLLREQSELEYLRGNRDRSEQLQTTNGISIDELARVVATHKGQEQKVAKLVKALEELKNRADQAEVLSKKNSEGAGLASSGYDQLKPFFTRLETLNAERTRIQERLDEGQIRAPTNGLVVKVNRFAGESCKRGEPFISFLEDDSLQVILYMPQKAADSLTLDQDVSLIVDPYRDPLDCKVVRIGDEYEPAPEHLKRYYSEGQKLLPVILQPSDESARWMALRVGGVVKQPHRWSPFADRSSP